MQQQKKYYCIDANVYIRAYRDYYAFDLVDSFWAHLIAHAKDGQIVSIDRIKAELKEKNDPLCQWAHGIPPQAFERSDRPDVIFKYQAIMQWVAKQNYTAAAVPEFARGADGWLIAYSLATGRTLVTHESYEPARLNKVKIPNVCKQFGVPYTDTFTMLRDLGLKIG